MRVLNLGSLNNDKVYNVAHIAAPGETISALRYTTFCGGKGLNQSIAVARAGVKVAHAGMVGPDGKELLLALGTNGVDTRHVRRTDTPSGHAIIQVNEQGNNCIIVYSGANACLTREYIDAVLEEYHAGDILLLQNEVTGTAYAMEKAKEKGMVVVLNPSPVTGELHSYPLELADHLILNEVEGEALSGLAVYEAMLEALAHKYPKTAIVLTIGRHGVLYARGIKRAAHGIYNVPVVDTTAAGDTFCGYYVAGVYRGLAIEDTLRNASIASSLAVSRKGASASIPMVDEVETFRQTITKEP